MNLAIWLEDEGDLHSLAISLALLGVAVLGWLLGEVDLVPQLAAWWLALTLLGPPQLIHDARIARGVLAARWPFAWLPPWPVVYCGLVALVLIGWFTWPAITFLVVLGLTGAHLGRSAATLHGWPEDGPVALAYGALPFLLPAAFHPAEVGAVWAWVAREPDPGPLTALLTALGPFLGIVWCTLAGFVAGRFLRRTGAATPILQLVAGAVLFGLAPPILALAAYLTLVHALPRLLQLARQFEPDAAWPDLPRLVRRSAPLVGAALVVGGFALVTARFLGAGQGQALALVSVCGFGAFAVAHMVFELLDPHQTARADEVSGHEGSEHRPRSGRGRRSGRTRLRAER